MSQPTYHGKPVVWDTRNPADNELVIVVSTAGLEVLKKKFGVAKKATPTYLFGRPILLCDGVPDDVVWTTTRHTARIMQRMHEQGEVITEEKLTILEEIIK